MKFRYLFLALSALCVAPLLPSCTYSQILQRQENGIASLNRVLAGVQDKTSADAAAPAVRLYGSELRQDISTLISNGRPSLVQLAMLKQSYQNSNIKQESKSALSELFRLYGQGFYGSTELRQAFLDTLLNSNSTSSSNSETSAVQPSSLLQNLQKKQNLNNSQKVQKLQNLQKLLQASKANTSAR